MASCATYSISAQIFGYPTVVVATSLLAQLYMPRVYLLGFCLFSSGLVERFGGGSLCLLELAFGLFGHPIGDMDAIRSVPLFGKLGFVGLLCLLSPRLVLALCALSGLAEQVVLSQDGLKSTDGTATISMLSATIAASLALSHAMRIPHDIRWWIDAPQLARATRQFLTFGVSEAAKVAGGGSLSSRSPGGSGRGEERVEERALNALIFREAVAPSIAVSSGVGFSMTLQTMVFLTGGWTAGLAAGVQGATAVLVLAVDLGALLFDALAPRLCPGFLARLAGNKGSNSMDVSAVGIVRAHADAAARKVRELAESVGTASASGRGLEREVGEGGHGYGVGEGTANSNRPMPSTVRGATDVDVVLDRGQDWDMRRRLAAIKRGSGAAGEKTGT